MKNKCRLGLRPGALGGVLTRVGIFFGERMENQLLEWAKSHRGSLRAITRKKGVAYLYRYCRGGGVVYNKNFPAGLDDEVIKAKIMEIEKDILLEKVGIVIARPQPEYQKRNGLGLRAFCEWFIETAIKEKLARITIKNCEFAVRRLIKFIGDENFLVNDIDRHRLDDFSRHLLETNSANGARTLLAKLHTVFQKGYYESQITSLPFVGFKYPDATEPKEKPTLTLAEMKDISGLFREWRTRLGWDILRLTGLRGNDAQNLYAENFDLKNCVLKFWSMKMEREEKLPLHPALVDIVRPYVRQSGKLFAYKGPGSFSFQCGDKIRQLKGDSFRPSGSHTPRHSLARYLRNEMKWPIPDIALFLCHRPKTVTQRIYTHDSVEYLRELVDKLPLDGGA